MTSPLRVIAIAAALWMLSVATSVAQLASCTISSTSVSFGTYNVFSATPTDSTGTITYNCNLFASNISVTLSRGQSPTFSPRVMNKSSENLQYNLYDNGGRTNIWGDGTGGTVTYTRSNPPNSSDVNLTIYGRIPAGQNVSAGTFTDTVTATINF